MYSIMSWCFPILFFLDSFSKWVQIFEGLVGILFLCSFTIWPFSSVISFSIFYSKIILFLLHLVVGFSLCNLHRLFIRYFAKSCFVCTAWPCPDIFWVSLHLPISFELSQVVLSNLSAVSFLSFLSDVPLRIFPSYELSLVAVSSFIFLS